jgi:Reverse transcriptase (RNA-dependent DNA polymerase)/GAG-pre-integrase domain/gag-polypeptide of LTR copia-type
MTNDGNSLTLSDATRPVVEKETIKSAFKSDKLDKDKGNWTAWRREIQTFLDMIGLSPHLTDDISTAAPPLSLQPNAHRNYLSNDRSVRGYIKSAVAKTEFELIDNLSTAKDCWNALSTYHLDEGPIKQANLIQEALTTRITRDDQMMVKLRKLRDDITRAFDMPGGINKETFTCILALQSLGAGLEHSRAIIQRDMRAATASSPYTADNLIKFMEQEYQMLVGDLQREGKTGDTVALTVQNNSKGRIEIICVNCKRKGHTHPYCVHPGGGMAGKTIEESKEARRKDKESKAGKSVATPSPSTSSRVRISVKGSDGRAYVMLADPSSITPATETSNQEPKEFAGIASIQPESIPLECIEYHGFMALIQEEPDPIVNSQFKANINWDNYSTQIHPTALSIIESTSAPISVKDIPFFLDSGASSGISPDKNDFVNLRPFTREVKGIEGSSITAHGIGDIRIQVTEKAYLWLKNSLFIPNATVRLISISSLTNDSNALVHFDDKKCWITNRSTGITMAEGSLLPNKNLYALNTFQYPIDSAYSITHTPSLNTWHRRLGHANFQTINDMARKGMIKGMPSSTSNAPPKCDSCILGKQTKTPVPKKREEGIGHRASRKLEKVWVDLIGPMAVTSRTGNKYMMDIVDDYTSHPWSIPLKTKSDAFRYLKGWELAREKETGLQVGTYITDGGELKSDEMAKWLESRGIAHLFTAPYTSAHIGRVERMHRTLMGKARTMKTYANLPDFLWDELYLTAAHLTAKTITRSLGDITPFEKWFDRKPDYSYMREIGCKAFVLIQNKHNPKVYERSLECILIGYEPNAKSYRCYHRPTRQVISSYHVRFLESHEGHSPQSNLPQSNPPQSLNPLTMPNVPETAIRDDDDDIIDTEKRSSGTIDPSMTDVNKDITDIIEAPDTNQTDEVIDAQPLNASTQILPRRSSRVSTKTVDKSEGIVQSTRLKNAIQQSKESAQRLAAERLERQTNNSTHSRYNPPPPNDNNLVNDLCNELGNLRLNDNTIPPPEIEQIDRTLAAIADIPQTDLDNFDLDEPNSWNEAKASSYSEQWETGYKEELQSLKDMGVYKLIHRSQVPIGAKIRKGRPVFRLKRDADGKPIRWKVRLVFKGFEQIYGKDYTSTTSPTARMESWRILLHIAAAMDWDAQQIDVKTAFLYGLLPDNETQYMEQPPGFEEPGMENHVWMLQRGLYGMKQSGRIWNQTMNDAMLSWGFTRLSCESCIYFRKSTAGTIISAVHVDDFLSIASSKDENERFKSQMKSLWTISDLGEAKHCVGIAINRNRTNKTVYLSQKSLIDKIIQQFGQQDSHPTSTPMDPGLKLRRVDKSTLSKLDVERLAKIPYRSLVGCLIYLAIGTRPDISYAVQQLSQFLDSYTYGHWTAAIRVVRYLKGTRDLELTLGGSNNINIIGFTDSDWANCPDTRRSVGGYLFTLGSGPISWQSRRQRTVATSSCEAEYTAAFEASKEAIWLRTLLSHIGFSPTAPTTLLCDNNATITLSEDPAFHARVKHFDVRYHFLRERVQLNEISLSYINTRDNIADIFTKPLGTTDFARLRTFLGLTKQDSMRGGVC